MFDRIRDLVNVAKRKVQESSRLSGEALVLLSEAKERLEELLLELRSMTRYELSWTKWHKEVPPKLFVRWDDALKAAVMEISLLYTDFNVRMVEEEEEEETDGTACTYVVEGNPEKAVLTVSTVKGGGR